MNREKFVIEIRKNHILSKVAPKLQFHRVCAL